MANQALETVLSAPVVGASAEGPENAAAAFRGARLLERMATEVRHSIHEILGFLELAAGESSALRQAEYLSFCRAGADRLLGRAGDLAELSGARLPEHVTGSFLPSLAVSEVADLAEPVARRKGVSLEWSVAPACEQPATGAHELIQDIVRRVLDNAVRFSDQGYIRVAADVIFSAPDSSPAMPARSSALDSSTVERQAWLAIEVTDSGPGMPQETMDFLHAEGRGTGEDRGMLSARGGFGLAVVRQRVALMGGQLSIAPSASKGPASTGTAVQIRLPIRVEPRETSGIETPETGLDHHPMNILIAEDSEDSFLLFQSYVGREGHAVTRALNGTEAVQLAKRGGFHLIVMDVNMPVLDGYSATQEIRDWESATDCPHRTPILLFSADQPSRQADAGRAVGCSGYLTKPATKEEVLRALRFFGPPHDGPVGAGAGYVRGKEPLV